MSNKNEENETKNKNTQFEETTISLSDGQFVPQKGPRPKNKLLSLGVSFVAIILIAGGGYWVWNSYLSPEARSAKQMEAQYQKYLDFQDKYETAMKDDIYGGSTAQETLDMFIDALKKGDLELASKYFILREDGSRDPKILEALNKKTQEEINNMVNVLKEAIQTKSPIEGRVGFKMTVNQEKYIIGAQLNTYSKIWKIESI